MLGIKKGQNKELCGRMPLHYPADRVYLHGNTNDDVEEAIDELSDESLLETVTLSSAVASGSIKIYKAGKYKRIVVTRLELASNLSGGSAVAVATGVTNKPSTTTMIPLQSAVTIPAFLSFDTSGNIDIINSASTASKIYAFGQYIYG